MKINWKLRLKNRATLSALIAFAVALVFQVLGWFGVSPAVTQNEILQAISYLLEILSGLGIIVDPTTAGIDDSDRAMQYKEPSAGSLESKPEVPEGYFERTKEDE